MRPLPGILAVLLSLPLAAADLRLELVRHSLTGTHCRYREYVEDVPTERYVTRQCSATLTAASIAGPARTQRVHVGGRVLRREIVTERPLEPFAYDYDERSGLLVRTIPLFFRGKPALVFHPNPVVALNDPSLQDRNDSAAAVPANAYERVELEDVADEGVLRGPHAATVDRQAPAIAPPSAAGSLEFDREHDGFEYVNAYHHIDASQRHLQALGFVGQRAVVPYAVEVDAHAANGSDNSYFIPSNTQPGIGTLYFGDGGTDDAEDADLVVHEYAHAILEWIAPGTFTGAFASQARALAEGFGDYWAYSTHVAERLESGRDPFCFADWDARCWEDDASQNCGYPPGTNCLRRLDSTRTMADYEPFDSAGVEYRNGSIWSSALREIHEQLGRTITDSIVIESIFGTPPDPSFAVMAQRMIEADRLLYGGVHRDVICDAMASRGIVSSCTISPRGETTRFGSSDVGIPIPENSAGIVGRVTVSDPRPIEKLFVRVDIAHPSRGDLRIELVAPDGTRVLLQEVSFERTADVRTTFGLTAIPVEALDVFRGMSAAGTWQLVVRDLRARDLGTLLSWGLEIQFAGEPPVTSRPRDGRTQMIPVVTRVYGVGMTQFASDVRIANPSGERREAMMIFTPSGADGTVEFAALRVSLEPGQTVGFDDVVASAFATSGSGSLEILGDVVAMSRTYALRGGGTMGQQVPPVSETTASLRPPLFVFPMPGEGLRTNIGFVETSGKAVSVRTGGSGSARTLVPPFGHVQYPWRFESRLDVFGEGTLAAYVSQVDEVSGDAMFVPASNPDAEREGIAPAIRAGGVGGSEWRSDLWISLLPPGSPIEVEAIGETTVATSVPEDGVFEDVLLTLFDRQAGLLALRMTLAPYSFAGTRVRNGRMSQYIPFEDPDAPAEQQLLFIENSAEYRTNIGIASDFVEAEVIVYDAAGRVVQQAFLGTPGGVSQLAVTAPVTHGRAVVRVLAGRGRAFASLVDNRTGDATYIAGQ